MKLHAKLMSALALPLVLLVPRANAQSPYATGRSLQLAAMPVATGAEWGADFRATFEDGEVHFVPTRGEETSCPRGTSTRCSHWSCSA